MKIRDFFKSDEQFSNFLYDYEIYLQDTTIEIEQANLFIKEDGYDIASPTKERRLIIPKAEVKYIEESNCIEETATSLNNLVRVQQVLDLANQHESLKGFKQEFKQELCIEEENNEN